jgi:hypothetical protein
VRKRRKPPRRQRPHTTENSRYGAVAAVSGRSRDAALAERRYSRFSKARSMSDLAFFWVTRTAHDVGVIGAGGHPRPSSTRVDRPLRRAMFTPSCEAIILEPLHELGSNIVRGAPDRPFSARIWFNSFIDEPRCSNPAMRFLASATNRQFFKKADTRTTESKRIPIDACLSFSIDNY